MYPPTGLRALGRSLRPELPCGELSGAADPEAAFRSINQKLAFKSEKLWGLHRNGTTEYPGWCLCQEKAQIGNVPG